jgi:hypothetical protein
VTVQTIEGGSNSRLDNTAEPKGSAGHLVVVPTGRVLPDLTLGRLGAEIKAMVREHDDRLLEIGRKLIRARDLAKAQGVSFKDFLRRFGISKSWAYMLISIAHGDLTAADYRMHIRNAMVDSRERKKQKGEPKVLNVKDSSPPAKPASSMATEAPIEPDGDSTPDEDRPSRVVRALAAFDALDAPERAEFLARRGLREIDDGIPVSLRHVA